MAAFFFFCLKESTARTNLLGGPSAMRELAHGPDFITYSDHGNFQIFFFTFFFPTRLMPPGDSL